MEIKNIGELTHQALEMRPRIGLFKEKGYDSGLLIYKPGDKTPSHKHDNIDEIFYILAGEGTISVDDAVAHVKEGDVILSPAGENHGFENHGSSNWMVLQVKIEGGSGHHV